MSDIDKILEDVERLDAAATPGPWFREEGDGSVWAESVGNCVANTDHCPNTNMDINAALIAEYRTAAPALAAEVLRLRAKLVEAGIEISEHRANMTYGKKHEIASVVGDRYGIRLKFEDGKFTEDTKC